jgi:hypothetical protein
MARCKDWRSSGRRKAINSCVLYGRKNVAWNNLELFRINYVPSCSVSMFDFIFPQCSNWC